MGTNPKMKRITIEEIKNALSFPSDPYRYSSWSAVFRLYLLVCAFCIAGAAIATVIHFTFNVSDNILLPTTFIVSIVLVRVIWVISEDRRAISSSH